MMTFNTAEEFDAYDAQLAVLHEQHMRANGYPDYWCSAVFGTPEPDENGKYVLTDAMLANYPHLI